MESPQSSSKAPATDVLANQFVLVRSATEALAAPLSDEDQVVQSMPDASPVKWHRAHTTWFFETFVLQPSVAGYKSIDASYAYLFNSYYEGAGPRHDRASRGLITRPSVSEVGEYRQQVDEAVLDFLDDDTMDEAARALIELGLHHEQQHQELLLMDIKYTLSVNPVEPVYRGEVHLPTPAVAAGWESFPAGVVSIGHDGDGFAFDNESPRHDTFVPDYELASRPVTCGEYADFIADGGYQEATMWLSDGWAAVQANNWTAPEYWRTDGNDWTVYTLDGRRPIDRAEPVSHVSYYEADAYARWSGARLPTEAEWERAVADRPVQGNFIPSGRLHPGGDLSDTRHFGDVWEWTQSAYLSYPGFVPAPGAVGEYNAKFMVNQQVLRGGSCLTPGDHVRATYRNFFPAGTRWHCSGIRLAR